MKTPNIFEVAISPENELVIRTVGDKHGDYIVYQEDEEERFTMTVNVANEDISHGDMLELLACLENNTKRITRIKDLLSWLWEDGKHDIGTDIRMEDGGEDVLLDISIPLNHPYFKDFVEA